VTTQLALDLAERGAAIAVLLGAAELVVARAELRPGGVLSWRVLSLRARVTAADRLLGPAGKRGLLDPPGVLWLAAAYAGAAVLMFAAPRLLVGPALCLALHVLLSRRHAHALDGSDDMLVVLLGTACLRNLDRSPAVEAAAAAFLCAQVCLAYLTSGLSKAQSPLWWNGSGLRGTLTTVTYGTPTVSRLVVRHPAITRILGPATIAWESCFFLAVLAGPRPVLVALAVAAGFHIACAFVMGLAAFVWTFLATFPSVYVVSDALAARLDTAQRAVAVSLGGVLVAAAAGNLADRAPARRFRFARNG
jgi:hypothetical protein